MNIIGAHIAYLHTCHRKLWLFAHGIQMEHASDIVAEGKLISKTTSLNRVRISEILQKIYTKTFFGNNILYLLLLSVKYANGKTPSKILSKARPYPTG